MTRSRSENIDRAAATNSAGSALSMQQFDPNALSQHPGWVWHFPYAAAWCHQVRLFASVSSLERALFLFQL